MIPADHKNSDAKVASVRQEVRFGIDEKISKLSIKKAVSESNYTLIANVGEQTMQVQSSPIKKVPVEKLDVGKGKKRRRQRVGSESESPAKKRGRKPIQTPKKKGRKIQAPPTPPETLEKASAVVVYDMTQSDNEVEEVICKIKV